MKMKQNSSTSFLLIVIPLIFVTDLILTLGYKVMYILISIFISILFYYLYYASMHEYNNACLGIESIIDEENDQEKSINKNDN